MYEGGHRIPLIMRYDGLFPANQRRSKLIGINDIFATVCDLVGIEIPKGDTALDSKSFVDYIKDEEKKKGLRNYLGVWLYNGEKPQEEAMITNKYKVVHILPNSTHPNGTVEYYNLLDDPGETIDLSKTHIYRNRMQFLLKNLNALTTPLSTATPTMHVPMTLAPIASAPTAMPPTKVTGNPTIVMPTKSTDPPTGAPTCGLCCADDPKFRFKTFDYPHPDKDCAWVTKRYMRKKRYCNNLNIKIVCLFTCDNYLAMAEV